MDDLRRLTEAKVKEKQMEVEETVEAFRNCLLAHGISNLIQIVQLQLNRTVIITILQTTQQPY